MSGKFWFKREDMKEFNRGIFLFDTFTVIFFAMRTFRVISIVLLFVIPFQSHAWGLLGHRVVGEIAEKYLTPKARKAVKDILGYESMAITSNWPDFIKSDTSYRYLSIWHYVNLGDSMSHADVMKFLSNDSAVNVYTKTNWLIKELKNKSLPKEKQLLYLRLLIHFIGDIHEPMHEARETDQGGNKIKVSWFNEPTNLHTVWDTKLIDDQQLSYTEYAAAINHATPAEIQKWQKQPIAEWVYESYVISRKIYENTPADSKLSYNYSFKWIATANQQMLKGGIRLAAILNEIFK